MGPAPASGDYSIIVAKQIADTDNIQEACYNWRLCLRQDEFAKRFHAWLLSSSRLSFRPGFDLANVYTALREDNR